MKKIIFLSMIILSLGLFAEGQKEGSRGPWDWQEGSRLVREGVELEGTIEFGIQAFPVFVSQGKTYELRVPAQIYRDLNIASGTSAKLKGFAMTYDDGKGNITYSFMPIEGTVGNQKLERPERGSQRGGRSMNGPMDGPMNGRGMEGRGPRGF